MNPQQIAQISLVLARNLALGGNLAALTLARNPHRMISYVSENIFLYKGMAQKRGLPQKNVFRALESSNVESITLGNLNGVTWFNQIPSFAADIINLCLLCRIVKPKVVFEIGTYDGYTALHFALNTEEQTRIFTLDLPQKGGDPLSSQSRLWTTSSPESPG